MKSASINWKGDAKRENSAHLSLFPDVMKENIKRR